MFVAWTVVAVRRPGAAVVRHAEDQLRGRDAAPRRPRRCRGCRSRSAESGATEPTGFDEPSPVVVAHDEDRVGAARRGRRARSGSCRWSRSCRTSAGSRERIVVELGPDRRGRARRTRPRSPDASGSKSRLTPSAPRSRTAAATCLARLARAVELPRKCFWRSSWPEVQPKLWMVRTTRVRFSWAVLMRLVIFELVQPLQPTVVVPSLFRFWRLPAASMPTPK